MLIADDVLRRALEVRDGPAEPPVDFEKLEPVVRKWANSAYRDEDERRIDTIEAVLKSSESMPKELAEAVNWVEPADSSAELVLLAVTAMHEGKDQDFAAVFEGKLDWQQWKSSRDLRKLQARFEIDSDVRNKFARKINAYPGNHHLHKLAAEVIHLLPSVAAGAAPPEGEEAQFEVLKKYLLNWEAFSVGRPCQEPGPAAIIKDPNAKAAWERENKRAECQQSHLKVLLEKYYAFRQEVAAAVGQANSEAEELAGLAVEMWRSIPSRRLIGRDRAGLIKKLDGKIPDELQARKVDPFDPDDWERTRESLAVSFANDPGKASVLWEEMEWPYPFALVLREELKQIQKRWSIFSALRPKTVANGAGQSAAAAGSPPGGGRTPSDGPWTPGKRPVVQDAGGAHDASDLAVQMKLFGLAFSGGGIRSATFNLGVLQKLSDFGLLGEVDYLSTVSGGGYIGSWLTGWMQKRETEDPAKFHIDTEKLLSPTIPDPRADAQQPVRFLREFSNYLTPRLGSFSFDTWTMVAVYSRNLILNQATLISVLGFALLLPRFMTFAQSWQIADGWMWKLAMTLVVAGVYCMTVNIRGAVEPNQDPVGRFVVRLKSKEVALATPPPLSVADSPGLAARLRRRLVAWVRRFCLQIVKFSASLATLAEKFNTLSRNHVQSTVIAPFLAAMYFGSLWMWRNLNHLESHTKSVLIGAAAVAVFLSLLLSLLGGFYEDFRKRQVGGWWLPLVLVLLMITALSAGSMTGLLVLDLKIMMWLKQLGDPGKWSAVIWAPVMALAVMVIPGTLQVGLMGVDFPDAGREWLSRFRAICTVYSIWWIGFLGAAIYGPWLVWTTSCHIGKWASGITLGWVVTTIGGLLAGQSKKTGTDGEGAPKFSWLQVLARLGPPVFVAGLVLLIATGEQVLLAHGAVAHGTRLEMDAHCLRRASWMILERHHLFDWNSWFVDHPGNLLLVLFAAGMILAWRVDINEFSMHHFYKNRLVRCYLGASNDRRRPNEFTGFDARDDLRLAQLRAIPAEVKAAAGKKGKTQAEKKEENTAYLGPYPILNTTLNLSTGEELAFQERKGTSFILTPCFCGFDVQGWTSTTAAKRKPSGVLCRSEELLPAGYRKTEGFTNTYGPYLGTSFSISGAAANPNQGYNTAPTVAFLMTMFDVRLGWWLGNPRRKNTWMKSSPTFGLAALLSELLGMTNDTARFVNLSDGGHFDNMGLYELVRRRCSFIVLCDAEQDPEYKFEGLGSAIRKCRIDFGAFIEIDTSLIRPKDGQPSGAHCAVGRIWYLDGSEGALVYIKPSLTGDEPEDVTQYQRAHTDFPHETTADQWFTESQFESYRALGYHATDLSLKPAGAWIDWNPKRPDVPKFIKALKNYWYPDNPNLKENASRHTATLVGMLDSIRKTQTLQDLGTKLFPGISVPLPSDEKGTQEFYFGLSILQLVEDVYFDFKLDRTVWKDDPRIGGWIHLFRTWKSVPAVASAWASERNTFRKDFQIFWDGI